MANPKFEAIDFVFGPLFNFLENNYIAREIVIIAIFAVLAAVVFGRRKKGQEIKAYEVIIVVGLLLGIILFIRHEIELLKVLRSKDSSLAAYLLLQTAQSSGHQGSFENSKFLLSIGFFLSEHV